MKSDTYKSRLKQAFLPVSCLVFTYLVFTPFDLVKGNQSYLSFTANDFIWQFLALALILSVVGSLVMALFRGKVFKFFLCGVCGLILATYIQALFLNNNLGTLDGTELPWSEMKTDMLINGIIWLVLILSQYVLSHFVKESYKTVAFVLALAIFGSQLISCVTVILTGHEEAHEMYILDGNQQYTVSSKDNIIVFSLDYFSKNYLDEILEKYPQTYDEFKDFTYYDNTSGNYLSTFPSLAALYTGELHDGTIPAIDYLNSSWHSEKAAAFYDTLHENDYHVNIFADANYSAGYAENMLGKVDNVNECNGVNLDKDLTKGIIKVSLFRTLPLCAKQYVWLTTDGLNSRVKYDTADEIESIKADSDFYAAYLSKGLSVTDEYNIYSWHHLLGAHVPYSTNEVFEYTGEETDPVTQSRGYLYAISQYINEMKELGVYDNATIVVTADHGDGANPFVALMIKEPNERHDTLQINSSPIMHNDLMPTLISTLGEDSSYFGRTVHEVEENELRSRTFRYHTYDAEYKSTGWAGELGQWNVGRDGEERYNVYRVFTFTGNQDTLYEMMKNKDYETVQMVDSFY